MWGPELYSGMGPLGAAYKSRLLAESFGPKGATAKNDEKEGKNARFSRVCGKSKTNVVFARRTPYVVRVLGWVLARLEWGNVFRW